MSQSLRSGNQLPESSNGQGKQSEYIPAWAECLERSLMVLDRKIDNNTTGPGWVSVNKTMWTLILLIGFLPVSGALWAEKNVTGVVGRAITIDCHYEAKYRSHTKYWCHGWTRYCSVLVETKGQQGRSGRVSITDNPERGIFTVTMEDLRSGDTGWYGCGITTAGPDPIFNIHFQVSDEPVSVPVVRYLSPANVSRLGGSVSVSCESFQGSLPIRYTWYEITSSGNQNISDTNELALHCQSFNHQHHQYYCNASNWLEAKSSAMVKVTVFNNGEICSYVTEINGTISGALWAEDKVRGVVGKAITIDCHYAPVYRSDSKYLCRMWGRQCTLSVNTNGTIAQYGRMTIRDNTSQGIFTVTMENLVSNDTGYYRCGIKTSGNNPVFDVHLIVSDEPVSVPVLHFLSSANGSCGGGSVSLSCESVLGSLPIQYTWYENISSLDSKISNTSKLDLRCQSFKHQNHQYYCRASNTHGAKSSEIVNVSIYNRGGNCSLVIRFSGTGREYSCETFTTVSAASFMIWKIWKMGRWLLFALLMICTISVTWFTRKTKKPDESAPHKLVYKVK
ncbi:polymeric immunoglobulin receptor-like [Hemitrygon akajei]|uniref:polymeric immunoglobulin receptor-like n=1 Tax=Hemitrygon akajei TaxID=2704970 RepID=UPI003BF96D0E